MARVQICVGRDVVQRTHRCGCKRTQSLADMQLVATLCKAALDLQIVQRPRLHMGAAARSSAGQCSLLRIVPLPLPLLGDVKHVLGAPYYPVTETLDTHHIEFRPYGGASIRKADMLGRTRQLRVTVLSNYIGTCIQTLTRMTLLVHHHNKARRSTTLTEYDGCSCSTAVPQCVCGTDTHETACQTQCATLQQYVRIKGINHYKHAHLHS